MAHTDRPVAPTRRIRLALLDDHDGVLESLGEWFVDNAPEFDVVLRVRSWMQLVRSSAFPTDMVLMDMHLPEIVSVDARVRTCRTAGAKVVMLSANDSADERARAFAAGAAGFLAKSRPVSEVAHLARQVMGLTSDAALSPAWRPPADGGAATSPAERPALSDAERQALVLYTAGMTTKEVAATMNVKYETAKTYLNRVREKYGRVGRPTSTRSDLTRRASEDGYLN